MYLRQTLAASLTVAPPAYAAYQAATVVVRAATDRLVQRFGAVVVVHTAALLVAGALAGMAAAPSRPFAVLAAGAVGLGASVLAPLCLAAAARLRPAASEVVLARLNLFNYLGVITGGAVSGLLGSTGRFRLAYATPAALALLLLAAARHFTLPPSPARTQNGAPTDWAASGSRVPVVRSYGRSSRSRGRSGAASAPPLPRRRRQAGDVGGRGRGGHVQACGAAPPTGGRR